MQSGSNLPLPFGEGGGGQQSWQSMLKGFMGNGGASGLAGIFSNMFGGDPSQGYDDAMGQLQKYAQQAQGYQQPFWQAGVDAINPYQSMIKNMSDPSGFINGLMKNYSQSPMATNSINAGQNAANNAASASGLLGSTPYMQASQQNAQNIASQDQNNWLQNVLGVNTQALGGYGNLMGQGAGAANSLTNLFSNLGNSMAALNYGSDNASQNSDMNFMNSIGSLAGAGAMAFL